MKAESEIYKGIEFVRLSALPADQREALGSRAFSGKTIKILKGSELVVDCLPYSFYLDWYEQSYPSIAPRQIQPAYSMERTA